MNYFDVTFSIDDKSVEIDVCDYNEREALIAAIVSKLGIHVSELEDMEITYYKEESPSDPIPYIGGVLLGDSNEIPSDEILDFLCDLSILENDYIELIAYYVYCSKLNLYGSIVSYNNSVIDILNDAKDSLVHKGDAANYGCHEIREALSMRQLDYFDFASYGEELLSEIVSNQEDDYYFAF